MKYSKQNKHVSIVKEKIVFLLHDTARNLKTFTGLGNAPIIGKVEEILKKEISIS